MDQATDVEIATITRRLFVEAQIHRGPNDHELAYARTICAPYTGIDRDKWPQRLRGWLVDPGHDTGQLIAAPLPLGRLSMAADGWHCANGAPWQYRAATAFKALALIRDGQIAQVDEFFAYLAGLGVNCVRVFFTKTDWHQNLPPNWNWGLAPDQATLAAIPLLCSIAAKHRLYLHATLICDGGQVGLITVDRQQAWVTATAVELLPYENVALVELWNEPIDGDTVSFPGRVRPPADFITAQGCGTEEGPLKLYGSQVRTYHIPRDLPEFDEPGWVGRVLEGVNYLKRGYIDKDVRHDPTPGSVIHGEPRYIANGTNFHHQESGNNPDDCFTFARAASAPSWSGSCCHADSFQTCAIPVVGSSEDDCVTAWASGWQK